MHYRTGVELGIRAPLNAIKKAAKISDVNMVDCFFVPETHPMFAGVDAFSAIEALVNSVENMTLGTGIVNVFSRNKEMMLRFCRRMYRKSEGRFVLGLGTSAPIIIENMYKMKFRKPLFRLSDYTDHIKKRHSVPVYWAVVGDKITKLATKHADGVIFFLRPESEIRRSIKIIKNSLASAGRRYDQFDIISIRPTYIEDKRTAERMARMTIARYVGANEFYSKPLERAGFKNEVSIIRQTFAKHGLVEASRHVNRKLVRELAIIGNAKECAEQTRHHAEKTKVKAVISGFDLPKDGYSYGFFAKLNALTGRL